MITYRDPVRFGYCDNCKEETTVQYTGKNNPQGKFLCINCLPPTSAHTPGPWKMTHDFTGNAVLQSGGTVIAKIQKCNVPGIYAVAANMKLIETSPVLLEAAKRMFAVLEHDEEFRKGFNNDDALLNLESAIKEATSYQPSPCQ